MSRVYGPGTNSTGAAYNVLFTLTLCPELRSIDSSTFSGGGGKKKRTLLMRGREGARAARPAPAKKIRGILPAGGLAGGRCWPPRRGARFFENTSCRLYVLPL